MTEPEWRKQPLPAASDKAQRLGRWRLAALADVTAHRRQMRAALQDGALPYGAAKDAVER